MSSLTSSSARHCANCRNHGKKIIVKRHKKTCPYRACGCSKCQLTRLKRSVMAKQIQLRRDQMLGIDDDPAAVSPRPLLDTTGDDEPGSHQGEPLTGTSNNSEPELSRDHPGTHTQPPDRTSITYPPDAAPLTRPRLPQVSAFLPTTLDPPRDDTTNSRPRIWSLAEIVTSPVTSANYMQAASLSNTFTSYSKVPPHTQGVSCEPKRSLGELVTNLGDFNHTHLPVTQGNGSPAVSQTYSQRCEPWSTNSETKDTMSPYKIRNGNSSLEVNNTSDSHVLAAHVVAPSVSSKQVSSEPCQEVATMWTVRRQAEGVRGAEYSGLDTLDTHRDSLDTHRESLGTHMDSLGTHRESLGTHRESLGTHRESLGTHRESLGTHRESLGTHRESLGTHRDSLDQDVRVRADPSTSPLQQDGSSVTQELSHVKHQLVKHQQMIQSLWSELTLLKNEVSVLRNQCGQPPTQTD